MHKGSWLFLYIMRGELDGVECQAEVTRISPEGSAKKSVRAMIRSGFVKKTFPWVGGKYEHL